MTLKKHIIVAFFTIFLYLLPLFVLGEKSSIMVWDNLDSTMVSYKILAESGKIFASSNEPIYEIMNGLPRSSFGSEFSFMLWLIYFLGVFPAYCVNEALIRVIAVTGMYLLLKNHVLEDENEESNWIAILAATAFSLLPFWPGGGLTVAAQPIVLYAFLNIRKGITTYREWIILLLVPLYSSFPLGFVFFLCVMFFIGVYDAYNQRSFNSSFFFAVGIMTGLYLLVEYRLVMTVLFGSGFVPHRVEFLSNGKSLIESITNTFIMLVRNQKHAATLHMPFIFVPVLAALYIQLRKKMRVNTYYGIMLGIGAIAFFFGFWKWQGILALKQQIPLLRMFQFDRFYFLDPLLWYVLWAMALVVIVNHLKSGKKIVKAVLVLQIILLFGSNCVYSGLFKGTTHIGKPEPSFEAFFAEQQFSQIRDFIGRPQSDYRVVSIGLEPAVAQYNRFYTLDAYTYIYPLEYKHAFRQIIAKELAKDDRMKGYFDGWGSRCYIYVAELKGENFTPPTSGTIIHLDLNNAALKALGGEYVLSAFTIENAKENGLELLKVFSSEKSSYTVHLYKVY